MNKKAFVIVVGVDYAEVSDAALARAFEHAEREEAAEVHVVSVLPRVHTDPLHIPKAVLLDAEIASCRLKDHVEARLRDFAQPNGRRIPGRVVSHVCFDSPANGIVQLASDLEADLVVVGTHSRQGLSRLVLGSVAEGVLRLTPCPVLVIPPKTQLVEGPKIEPPCARCLEAREKSAELWCEQHRERHGRRHTYHQGDRAGTETNFPLVTN